MDPRLQYLLDEREIIDLTHRYCWAVDALDRAQMASVFLPDATADYGAATLVGFDAIWTFLNTTLEGLQVSQHLLGSHQVTVTGDTGHVRSYLCAKQVRATPTGRRQISATGKYEDDLVRTVDGWRIKHRRFTLQWVEADPRGPGG